MRRPYFVWRVDKSAARKNVAGLGAVLATNSTLWVLLPELVTKIAKIVTICVPKAVWDEYDDKYAHFRHHLRPHLGN